MNKSLLDHIIIEFEHGLRTCHTKPPAGTRPYPAIDTETPDLDPDEQTHTSGLMRVNNAGEVAAQGLYRGQALTARSGHIQQDLLLAAEEENEHLNWCQTRLDELHSSSSLLDPLWYWGAFGIGFFAGIAGDRWSLGFVAETEKQVTSHLQKHLQKLPPQDQRSQRILEQMKTDEMKHAVNAELAGAAKLPKPIKSLMGLVSKVMTTTAYRI
jgi:ubiquinone biosynthesis monooxygenase Coq7